MIFKTNVFWYEMVFKTKPFKKNVFKTKPSKKNVLKDKFIRPKQNWAKKFATELKRTDLSITASRNLSTRISGFKRGRIFFLKVILYFNNIIIIIIRFHYYYILYYYNIIYIRFKNWKVTFEPGEIWIYRTNY